MGSMMFQCLDIDEEKKKDLPLLPMQRTDFFLLFKERVVIFLYKVSTMAI